MDKCGKIDVEILVLLEMELFLFSGVCFNKKKYNSKSQSKCRLDRAIYWQQFEFYINLNEK